MKNYHNIEKHPHYRSTYIGYTGKRFGRRIVKSSGSYGNWCAYPHPGEGPNAMALFAFGLDSMSTKLTTI
jgi:hypothetical protein